MLKATKEIIEAGLRRIDDLERSCSDLKELLSTVLLNLVTPGIRGHQ